VKFLGYDRDQRVRGRAWKAQPTAMVKRPNVKSGATIQMAGRGISRCWRKGRGSVKAAWDAGSKAAARVGELVSSHIHCPAA